MKKVIKMILTMILLLIGSALIFTACAPQIGAASKHKTITSSTNYRDGRFHNNVITTMKMLTPEMWEATKEQFFGDQVRVPTAQIPSRPVSPATIGKGADTRVTWLGHSTLLVEIDGQVILTDPVFSERASPLSFAGPKRFPSETPLKLSDISHIDAVLISHDHYDHLDHQSILKLKEKVGRFYVPLGVGGHLKRWGVESNKVVELDWWQENQLDGLILALTPTRHFSGRGLRRDQNLWGSWVIVGETERIFFGGDSGYFDGFKEIGKKYGPFDITMLESGAYNKAWSEIHMMPEEAVQAHTDLKGKLLLPVHWAKFNLSVHSWTEPIERLIAAAKKQQIQVVAPIQGDSFALQRPPQLVGWWESVEEKKSSKTLASHIVTGRQSIVKNN